MKDGLVGNATSTFLFCIILKLMKKAKLIKVDQKVQINSTQLNCSAQVALFLGFP